MIDVEHAVIVDVEATPARTYDEVAATRTMIDRTETTFGLKPGRLAADTAYGTGKLLAWDVLRPGARMVRWRTSAAAPANGLTSPGIRST